LQRDPKSLLWDAREAAEVIAAVTAGKRFADFDRDIVLRSAVERQFEIIGEALAQLARIDAAVAQKVPDLRQIIAFRNVLIHGYATVDPARVWRVTEDNPPPLRRWQRSLPRPSKTAADGLRATPRASRSSNTATSSNKAHTSICNPGLVVGIPVGPE
jgi:uncharacterized protein with HEPN domain